MKKERFTSLDKLSLKELVTLKEDLKSSNGQNEFINSLEHKIKVHDENLNARFDFDKFQVIPKYEKEILERNGIKNLQQLIDANLNKIVDQTGLPIGEGTKEFLEWARHAYDMSSLMYNKETKNKQKVITKARSNFI